MGCTEAPGSPNLSWNEIEERRRSGEVSGGAYPVDGNPPEHLDGRGLQGITDHRSYGSSDSDPGRQAYCNQACPRP